MPVDPNTFVAKWYCSQVNPEDTPAFAADALEAGFDGPSLRRLAGLNKPTSADIATLFQSAIKEIGTVQIQNEEQAVIRLAKNTAQAIVDGEMDPLRGAEILAGYAMRLGYPPFLMEFFQLADSPRWGDFAPTRKSLHEAIVAEAKALIAYVPA